MSEEQNIKYSIGMVKVFDNLSYAASNELGEEDIVYASIAAMSLFYMLESENIIEKKSTKSKKNIDVTSKINDTALQSIVLKIAEKEGNGYRIGELYEENIPSIFALIKNKFAHGDYVIDVGERLVNMDIKGKKVSLPVEKLIEVVYSQIKAMVNYPKTKKMHKMFFIPPKETKKINNIEDIKDTLKDIIIRSYSIYNSKEELSLKDEIYFRKLMNEMSNNVQQGLEISSFYNKGIDYYKEKGIKFKYEERTLTKEQIDSLAETFKNFEQFFTVDPNQQIGLLSRVYLKAAFPEENNFSLLTGISSLLIILESMLKQKKYKIEEIDIDADPSIVHSAMDVTMISILAIFNSMYIVPFDGKYGQKNDTNLGDRIDYEKFNFGDITPKKIDSVPKSFKSTKKIITKTNEELKALLENYNKLLDAYIVAKNSNEQVDNIYQEIITTREKMAKLIPNYKEKINKYNDIANDYNEHKKYYYNVAMIEGIRNAISHGNVSIVLNDVTNPILVFKDLYGGKIEFELEIEYEKLREFALDNYKYMLDFYKTIILDSNKELVKSK